MKEVIVISVAIVLASFNFVQADNCTITRYGLDVDNPGTSCDDIYDKNPSSHGKSGQYLINNTEQLQLVYCEMKLMETWIEVVDFNTSEQITCPEGWGYH